MSSEFSMGHMPARDLIALLRVSLALSESSELDVVLQTAIECTVQALQVDGGAIYFSRNNPYLLLGAAYPAAGSDLVPTRLDLSEHKYPHIEEAIGRGRSVFIRDVFTSAASKGERRLAEDSDFHSLYFMPLVLESGCHGVLIVGSRTPVRRFTGSKAALCKVLSVQVAAAISNARLLETAQLAAAEIACAYDATLEGWSLALEMRDSETLGHTERTAQLAVEIADALGVEDEELLKIRRGALLHDIGKLGVPDSILKKPGPLTEDEWVIMRQHPEYALEFLERIDYLVDAIDIPYGHHERWDGTGYPQGLAGEEIPLAARVFAVIDVYDALTSDRPYRKAWDSMTARHYLREQSGIHFDPQAVDEFLEHVDCFVR